MRMSWTLASRGERKENRNRIRKPKARSLKVTLTRRSPETSWAEARSVGERATKTQTQGNAKDRGQPTADFSTLQTLLSARLFIHVYSLSQGLRTAEERAQGTH